MNDFKFRIGDRVVNKNNPSEYGEVCAISYTGQTVRVILQQPPYKLWWYDVEELELYK